MISPASPSFLRVPLIFPSGEPDAVWDTIIAPGLASVPGMAKVGAPIVADAAREFRETREVTREVPLSALPMLFPGVERGRLILTVRAEEVDGQWLGEILVYSDAVDIEGLRGVFTGALRRSGALVNVETTSRGAVQWHKSADGRAVLAEPATPWIEYPVSMSLSDVVGKEENGDGDKSRDPQ